MHSSRGVNELTANPDPASCFADTTFEDVAHAQLAADLLNVHGPPLVRKAGIACDDEETAKARQSRNNFLDHAISKILLLAVATQVVKWQNGDRWLAG